MALLLDFLQAAVLSAPKIDAVPHWLAFDTEINLPACVNDQES